MARSIDEQDLYPSFNESQPSQLQFSDVDDKKNEIILVMVSRPARGHDDPQALLHRDTQTDRQTGRDRGRETDRNSESLSLPHCFTKG